MNSISDSLLISDFINNKDQDDLINEKFNNRKEAFSSEDDYLILKENVMRNELNNLKNKKERICEKKRIQMNINLEQNESLKSKLTISLDLYEACNNMQIQLSNFNEIINAFKSDDIKEKYKGLVGIRKLTLLNNPPLQELYDMNIIPDLISILDCKLPEFHYESLWCLTNISKNFKEVSKIIKEKGGISKIVNFLESTIEQIKLQTIWLIGNLAISGKIVRSILIKEKALDKLIIILSFSNRTHIIKQATWALSNFLMFSNYPSFDVAKNCLKAIARVMNIIPKDMDFLSDASFILSSISNHYKESIKELFELDLIPKIINSLEIDTNNIQINYLRIIGNIACGNANQTQKLLDLGVLAYLKKIIFSKYKYIRKEAAWIISNIAAGTQKQIESLIREDILIILKQVLINDEYAIKRESIWAICNLTSIENPIYMKKILDQGILKIICECLKLNDAKLLAICLEALGNLLVFGEKFSQNPAGENPIVYEIEKMGMFDILEKLQLHQSEIVYEKTLKILEKYFDIQNAY